MKKVLALSVIALTTSVFCSFGFADETTNHTKMMQADNTPPGYHHDHGYGKTPSGWDKGKKRGWNKDKNKKYKHKHHRGYHNDNDQHHDHHHD